MTHDIIKACDLGEGGGVETRMTELNGKSLHFLELIIRGAYNDAATTAATTTTMK